MQVILLDFDGVILRRHPVHDTVAVRCKSFVQNCIPIRNPVRVQKLNQEMYEAYGHTVLGLQSLGYPVTTQEFNDYVYTGLNLSSLQNVRDTHERDISRVNKLLNTVKDMPNVRVKLFSNAPETWCYTVLDMMGITPIERLPLQEYLKPEEAAYNLVESLNPDAETFFFVDDKVTNFKNIMDRPHWKKLLYTGEDASGATHYACNKLMVLNDVYQLVDWVVHEEHKGEMPSKMEKKRKNEVLHRPRSRMGSRT